MSDTLFDIPSAPGEATTSTAWGDGWTQTLLAESLSAAVGQEIARLHGSSFEDRAALVAGVVAPIAEHGDELMYGGRHCKATFVATARALAVAAYQPGGVTLDILGHWCVYPHPWCPSTSSRAAPPCCVCPPTCDVTRDDLHGSCPDSSACPWCTNGCTPECGHG